VTDEDEAPVGLIQSKFSPTLRFTNQRSSLRGILNGLKGGATVCSFARSVPFANPDALPQPKQQLRLPQSQLTPGVSPNVRCNNRVNFVDIWNDTRGLAAVRSGAVSIPEPTSPTFTSRNRPMAQLRSVRT
jgi:hypothetical protein